MSKSKIEIAKANRKKRLIKAGEKLYDTYMKSDKIIMSLTEGTRRYDMFIRQLAKRMLKIYGPDKMAKEIRIKKTTLVARLKEEGLMKK